MRKKLPFVNIITVNHNGKHFLKDCFRSLFALNYPKDRIEIIMVDNCSKDDSLDFARKRYPQVKIIKNDVNNYCKANNLGIKKAKGELVALINNDTKVDKNWLIELVKVIESNKAIGAVGSKILFMDKSIQSVGHQEYPNFYWGDKGFEEKDEGQYDYIKQVPSICGAAVLYRKRCLNKVGLFDEDFNMFLEDVDMAIRCRKKRWKLLFCPSSVIYHRLHGSIGEEEKARFMQERNRLLLIAKHWPDKLPDALSGREYFISSDSYNKEKDICTIMSFVYMKLVKTHGIGRTGETSNRLFESLRKVLNLETNHLKNKLLSAASALKEKQSLLESETQKFNQILQSETQKFNQILQSETQKFTQALNEKQSQFELVRNELDGIYNSTGFRFILRPLWTILWWVKQTAETLWQRTILLKNSAIPCLKKVIKYIFRPTQLISKIRQRIYLITTNTQWARAYLSHINKNTFPPPPQKLTVMLTKRCNLNCEFCDFSVKNYRAEDMSRENAIKLIDSAEKLGIKDLEITGGEPLLHPELFGIIDYAKSKSMWVHITTNGLLLSRYINEIIASKPKTISVSIDGLEKTHDALRGSLGCYKEVLKGIGLLQGHSSDIAIAVNFVVTNKNVGDLEQVYNYFKDKGIKVYFWPVNNQLLLYLSSKADKKKYIDFAKRLMLMGEISPHYYRYHRTALRYFDGQRLNVRCLSLAQELAVDVDGRILPCCVWEEEDSKLGNIFSDDLEVLWHSDVFHKKRTEIFFKGCNRDCFNTALYEFSRITELNFLVKSNVIKTNKQKNIKSQVECVAKDKLSLPRFVHIKLTNRCNLSCKHCDLWKSGKQQELSAEQWKAIISRVYNWLGPFRLEFAGGEPFLYKDITEIIKYCSEKQIFTVLTTNATLINEDLAKKVINSGLSTINISLDAQSAKLHDYIRGKEGVFDKVIKAIDLLKEYRSEKGKPHICIAATIMRQNVKDLLKLVDYVNNGGADFINFQALYHNFGAEYKPEWFRKNRFWVKDVEKLAELIEQLKKQKRDDVCISNPMLQLDAMKDYFKDPLKFNQVNCDTGTKNFIIETNGDVLLCWNMPAIGNILKGDPENIWNNELSKRRREQIRNCKRTCNILNCNYL